MSATMRVIFAMSLVFTGCKGKKADDTASTTRAFPDGFLFGSATAGFQVDMGCPTLPDNVCIDDASDWYDWVTDPGILAEASLFVTGEPVQHGPGMWELLEQDAAQMAADGHTSYRMSVEWSRLFPDEVPDSVDNVDDLMSYADAGAVTRYHEMFAALRAQGIEPMVTMNHYTLPRWLHDGVACHNDVDNCTARGWLDAPRMVHHGRLFGGFLGREFGGDVDRWITLNEPYATTLSGYLQPGEDRSAPPGLNFNVDATKVVMLSQIEGHAAMYDGVKAEDAVDANGDGTAVEVGIVMNMTAIEPKDPAKPADVQSAEHMDYIYHQLYLDALTTGAWDSNLDGTPDETRADLAGRLDFIGINYYNKVMVTGLPFPLSDVVPVFDFLPEFSWNPYPEGLAEVLIRASAYNLPLHVTENGTPFVDEQGVEVLDGHMAALLDAIDAGADVRSYHYWSWVDNYEWNHGFALTFGLYELNIDTKERTVRQVGVRYREIIADGGL